MEKYEEPLTVFLDGLPNPTTRDHYKRFLGYFFEFLKLEGSSLEKNAEIFAIRSKEDLSWATSSVMKFIRFQKERVEKGEMSPSSISNYFKPIRLFCDMNDIELNWKKITRTIPKSKRYSSDRIPTKEEIKQILNYPDRRIKAAVLVMISSGIRLGAWDYLSWGDITPITKDDKIIAARMIVYKGDNEEYKTFITPEAYQALKEYVEFRISHGEIINEKSWVLRDEFDSSNHGKGLATVPKKLKSIGLTRLIERALWAEGIRKPLEKGQKRHPFKVNHGFRKFFNTMAIRSMKPILVEILMGHSIGVSDSYLRPSEKDILEEYLKAIPDLSIFEATPQEDRIQRLERQLRVMQFTVVDLMSDLGKDKSKKILSNHPKLTEGIEFYPDSDAMLVKDIVDGNEYLQ